MSNLYNVTTRQPEKLPEDQISDAVLQGTHSYPSDAQINVVKPSGDSVSVSGTDLPAALKAGYKLETSTDGAVRDYVEDNDNLAGTAKVALGKFADEAAMGIPGLVYEKTGDPLEVAKWEALKKSHDLATAAGSVGGFGASLFAGGPVFKAAGAAGKVVERAVAEKLAAAGIERGAPSMAKNIVARMATGGAKLGVEGAVISAPRALTEAALGDPEQAGETVLMGAGLGIGLGFLGGALSKPYEALKDVVSKASSKAISKISEQIESESGALTPEIVGAKDVDPVEAANTLMGTADAAGMNPEAKKTLAGELSKQKANAPQLIADHAILGIEPLESTLSSSKFVREADSALMNDPDTIVGTARAAKLADNFEGIEKAQRTAMQSGQTGTKFQTGESIKQSIIDRVEAEKSGISSLYDELGKTAEEIPVRAEGLKRIGNNILKIPEIQQGMVNGSAKSSSASLAKGIVDRLSNAKTLADLDIQIKLISEDLGMASTKGEQRIAGIIKEKLNNFYDTILDEQFSRADRNDLIQLRQQAKGRFSALMDNLGEIGAVTGKKNVGSPGAFLDFIKDMPSEKLAERLFAAKDPKFLDFFQKEFPQEFQAIIDQKKSAILEDSMHAGRVSPAKVFRAMDKFSPEVRTKFFNPEQQKLYDASKRVFENLPTQINPSGTERMRAYRGLWDKMGDNATAITKWAGIKIATHAKALIYIEQTMKHAAEKLDFIPKAIDSMNSSGSGKLSAVGAMSRLVGGGSQQDAFKKISKEIGTSVGNPTTTADKVSAAAAPIQGGAPNIAGQFSQKMTAAIQYLDSQMPKPLSPPNPLIKTDFKPSDHELSAFERRLNTVMDPASVIDDLKNGSLTKEQVETLQIVYPKLYQQIQKRVIQHISENQKTVPYQSRLKLSLLMGAPLDSSLSPQSIQAHQESFAHDQQNAQQGAPGPEIKSGVKLGMSERVAPQMGLPK